MTVLGITMGGGADVSVAAVDITLEGEDWIDMRAIGLDGNDDPLELSWIDDRTWAVTVPLEDGAHTLTLVATDLHGAVVGTDSVGVMST